VSTTPYRGFRIVIQADPRGGYTYSLLRGLLSEGEGFSLYDSEAVLVESCKRAIDGICSRGFRRHIETGTAEHYQHTQQKDYVPIDRDRPQRASKRLPRSQWK
jgi:hypothetical protein